MCLIPAGILFIVGLGLTIRNVPGAWAIGAVAVPLAMTVAVLRYHLYDLDVIISRAVVWLVMSMLVVAGFVAIVTLTRDLVFGGDLTLASLATTGLIAGSM